MCARARIHVRVHLGARARAVWRPYLIWGVLSCRPACGAVVGVVQGRRCVLGLIHELEFAELLEDLEQRAPRVYVGGRWVCGSCRVLLQFWGVSCECS